MDPASPLSATAGSPAPTQLPLALAGITATGAIIWYLKGRAWAFAYVALTAWYFLQFVLSSYRREAVAPTVLATPLWIPETTMIEERP